MHYLLFYDVVPDYVQRRQSLRAEHLAHARSAHARGDLILGGALAEEVMRVEGRDVAVVWMPYNWGFQGLKTGASVNHLTIDAGDPGAGTQETKACLVNVVKVREAAAETTDSGTRS